MQDKLDTNTIIWKSEYNIHNFKLDKEHQELFNIARETLHISKIKDDEQEISTKLKEIISKLFDYIKTHFVHEEDYMKKINYPELEEHKFLHKNITTMLTSLISDLNKLKLSEIGLSLFNFIEEYFIKHIVNEDKKIELWRSSICALKINYPYLEKHKKSHKYIMQKLNDFVKNLSNLDKNLFEKELVKIIDITFVYHVIKEDKKITIWEKNNLKR